jgi:hypothetical protein
VTALVLENRFGRSTAGEGPRPPANIAEAKLLPPFKLQPDPMAAAQTLERPLFVPSRRAAPPAEGGSGAMRKGQFILQGTTVVGGLCIALLKEVSTGTVHRVEKGGEIQGMQGMKVADVTPQQVVLTAGGDSETLLLLVARTTGDAAAAMERGPFDSSPAPAAAGSARPSAPGSASPVAAPASSASTPAQSASAPAPAPAASRPAMTPEEIISRRRAARTQSQN